MLGRDRWWQIALATTTLRKSQDSKKLIRYITKPWASIWVDNVTKEPGQRIFPRSGPRYTNPNFVHCSDIFRRPTVALLIGFSLYRGFSFRVSAVKGWVRLDWELLAFKVRIRGFFWLPEEFFTSGCESLELIKEFSSCKLLIYLQWFSHN
jgi:hypothetical protein